MQLKKILNCKISHIFKDMNLEKQQNLKSNYNDEQSFKHDSHKTSANTALF